MPSAAAPQQRPQRGPQYKMGRAAMRVRGVCVPRTVRALFCRFSHFAPTIDRTMGRQ